MASNHHVGFSGEAAVASEFSLLGYNVLLPLVDIGIDLYIEHPTAHTTWRFQMKTAQEKITQPNHYQFSIKDAAIHAPTALATHFALLMRIKNQWKIFIVSQNDLSILVQRGMGSPTKTGFRTFTFIHDPATGAITCSKQDMLPYSGKGAWAPWPQI